MHGPKSRLWRLSNNKFMTPLSGLSEIEKIGASSRPADPFWQRLTRSRPGNSPTRSRGRGNGSRESRGGRPRQPRARGHRRSAPRVVVVHDAGKRVSEAAYHRGEGATEPIGHGSGAGRRRRSRLLAERIFLFKLGMGTRRRHFHSMIPILMTMKQYCVRCYKGTQLSCTLENSLVYGAAILGRKIKSTIFKMFLPQLWVGENGALLLWHLCFFNVIKFRRFSHCPWF